MTFRMNRGSQQYFLAWLLWLLTTSTSFFVSVVALSVDASTKTTLKDYSTSGIYRVNGQRCRLIKCSSTAKNGKKQQRRFPPIVLLGGMAQTIDSWEHHINGLSRNRDLLIYECRGQGPPLDNDEEENKEKNGFYKNVSLPFQAELLCNTVQTVFAEEEYVDIVGFSLGGRVAMAAACLGQGGSLPIRKLHLTGVGAFRQVAGQVAVESWKDLLSHENNNLYGFAWSALQATYSPAFLHKNQNRLSSWVQFVVDTNTVEGLHALVEQTSVDESSDWHTFKMASRVLVEKGLRLVVGELDVMAPVQGAQELKSLFNNHDDNSVGVFENCGHAVPMEKPREWQRDVLDFLDKE